MKYNFDRSKPFYPIVVTYLAQLHGLKQMCAIGVLAPANIKRYLNIPLHLGDAKEEIESGIGEIMKPLSLEVTGEAGRWDVSVELIATEMASFPNHLLSFQVQAAFFCLVMAHEITKGNLYRDKGEKWEFLRHCRNAVAHNGKWHFTWGEPKKKAEWRGIVLEHTMHEKPLFVQADGKGSLKLGDPIALLWDIEQEIPNISV